MKKYRLTEETKVINGHTLHRIEALKDFGGVKKGELGGWIEKEDNLSQNGECWICDEAKVYGDAKVFDDAWIYGEAEVHDNAFEYWKHQGFSVSTKSTPQIRLFFKIKNTK